jgi:mRNA-degrading endonuclease RelE of RelBE toxin-antitoxin system
LTFKISYTFIFFKTLDALPLTLRKRFIKKIEKIKKENISRKHLKYGLPYFVEKVTKSSRIIYKIEDEHLIFIICFKNHKNYKKWYSNIK